MRSRSASRWNEFIHTMSKIISSDYNEHLVITDTPNKITEGLKNMCDIEAEYKPVYEGIKGISLSDPRRREGYEPKIIGYKFRKKK